MLEIESVLRHNFANLFCNVIQDQYDYHTCTCKTVLYSFEGYGFDGIHRHQSNIARLELKTTIGLIFVLTNRKKCRYLEQLLNQPQNPPFNSICEEVYMR